MIKNIGLIRLVESLNNDLEVVKLFIDSGSIDGYDNGKGSNRADFIAIGKEDIPRPLTNFTVIDASKLIVPDMFATSPAKLAKKIGKKPVALLIPKNFTGDDWDLYRLAKSSKDFQSGIYEISSYDIEPSRIGSKELWDEYEDKQSSIVSDEDNTDYISSAVKFSRFMKKLKLPKNWKFFTDDSGLPKIYSTKFSPGWSERSLEGNCYFFSAKGGKTHDVYVRTNGKLINITVEVARGRGRRKLYQEMVSDTPVSEKAAITKINKIFQDISKKYPARED